MAYTLEAFVLPSSATKAALTTLPSAVAVPLEQGLSLIPLTDAFAISLGDRFGAGMEFEFKDMPTLKGSAVKWAEQVSHASPVAFLEAEFFGGQGSQVAIGWQAGQITFGPLRATNAINQALRWLEIMPAAEMDEFDTLRLGRFRSTEKWARR